jgi:hypothetical protein
MAARCWDGAGKGERSVVTGPSEVEFGTNPIRARRTRPTEAVGLCDGCREGATPPLREASVVTGPSEVEFGTNPIRARRTRPTEAVGLCDGCREGATPPLREASVVTGPSEVEFGTNPIRARRTRPSARPADRGRGGVRRTSRGGEAPFEGNIRLEGFSCS